MGWQGWDPFIPRIVALHAWPIARQLVISPRKRQPIKHPASQRRSYPAIMGQGASRLPAVQHVNARRKMVEDMPILPPVMPIISLTHPTRSVGSATPPLDALGTYARPWTRAIYLKLCGHLGRMSSSIPVNFSWTCCPVLSPRWYRSNPGLGLETTTTLANIVTGLTV